MLSKQYSLNQLHAEIQEDNVASIRLFEKSGFKETGVKKNWVRNENSYLALKFYQFFF
jgi:diamine N-acetyltransferase